MNAEPRIVVGIDETRHRRDALGLAQALLGSRAGELHVAYSHPYAVPRLVAQRHVRDSVAALHVPATCHLFVGISAAEVLHDLARDLDAELIVVGSSHHGKVGRVLLGDGGACTVHHAPCPVALAPSGWRTARTIETIGVAYDGSPESRQAVERVESIARGLRAPIRLVCVVDPAADGEPRARETLQPMLDLLGDRGDCEIRTGDVVEELRAASGNVDLLVVGSRGRGPLQRVFAGSTSMAMLREAACPVMIVPRPSVPADGAHDPWMAVDGRITPFGDLRRAEPVDDQDATREPTRRLRL